MEEDAAERIKRYRKHAEEIYIAAGDVTHSPSHLALLRLAETYERLAARIEADLEGTIKRSD